MTPRPIHPILRVFPLDQIADVGAEPRLDPRLISREIIFEVFQPMCSLFMVWFLNVTSGPCGRTDVYVRQYRPTIVF